jgi:DNA-binding transcriptional MerR regulator
VGPFGGDTGESMAETMTIAELASSVGMTSRNIRAYQSRGLVHPPKIKGRVAYYNPAHAARLLLIASLQREGFTLAAIKRLIETPDTYASIVADRRRRFRDETSDISTAVPLPEKRIREVLPDLPADLTQTGLVWWEGGQLVTHALLMGVGRTLVTQGVPPQLLARLQLEAAQTAQVLGRALREHLHTVESDPRRRSDIAKVALQLSAAAFEIAFLKEARPRPPQ